MSEDMTEVVKYIAWREEQLSNYSDKLRQNIRRVFHCFGDPDVCQVCQMKEDASEHFEYTTHDDRGNYWYINEEKKNELLQTGRYIEGKVLGRWKTEDGKIIIEKNKDMHAFIPKIRLSLDVTGEVFFTDETKYGDKMEFKLASREGELVILKVYFKDEEDCLWPSMVSRKILKEIVKTKAISQFLQEYQKQLDQVTKEYQLISSLAEKMASVL